MKKWSSLKNLLRRIIITHEDSAFEECGNSKFIND
jgi:hypothetical protein